MDDILRFSLPEIVALLGAAQSIYILVYMLFRSGRLSRGTLPAIYFLVLSLAFIFDAAQRFWGGLIPYYSHYQWLFWFSGPPLSMLLVLQIANITRVPHARNYLILFLIPISYMSALKFSSCDNLLRCDDMREWLLICGLVMGGLSLLAIWFRRDLLSGMKSQKHGKERYWLIIFLIILNVTFLAIMLLAAQGAIAIVDSQFIRGILGIAFVYTAATSLMRIYPQAMRIHEKADNELSDDEIAMALQIEKLLTMDKVYQEPSYGRKDLAKELKISEAVLSRIVNGYFEKSLPNLLNEKRVEEAKHLLKDTKENVNVVAKEAGFNSLASFNRLFKEFTGVTPSAYRDNKSTT